MSRKGIIIILLGISWPVDNIHRLLNAHKEWPGHWYPFRSDYIEDLQWYIHDLCQAVSYLLIFIAIQLYISSLLRKDSDISLIFKSILIMQILDVIHYIGWHRTSELVLIIEGLFFLYISIKIIKKHTHGQTR